MDIKMTPVARGELNGLDPDTRKTVIGCIRRDLVREVDENPRVMLEELGTQVQVFPIKHLGMRVLYRREDVDNDGDQEVVILTVVGREELAQTRRGQTEFFSTFEDTNVPRHVRIGHEALSKIANVDLPPEAGIG